MSTIIIKNANLILRDRILRRASLLIRGPKIASIGRRRLAKESASIIINATGCYVSPGFIDCHIHGDPAKVLTNEIKFGTTSVVIAKSCAPLGDIFRDSKKIDNFIKKNPLGPCVLGVHLEGPYISFAKRGAQNKKYIKRSDARELGRIIKGCGGLLRIMTVAPEIDGAPALVKLLKKNRIIASAGHSDATGDEASGGISAGIRHATHIFNAMSAIAALRMLADRRVSAEIILDLIHVDKALFGLLIKSKPHGSVMLVTDSVAAEYSPRLKKNGVYRLKDGTTAGSALTMIKAVENAVKAGGLSLVEAVRLASFNPAGLLGISGRKGTLEPGKDADIIVFDRNFKVKMTIIGGRIVFRKGLKGKTCAA